VYPLFNREGKTCNEKIIKGNVGKRQNTERRALVMSELQYINVGKESEHLEKWSDK
jgi:hypothetical protein